MKWLRGVSFVIALLFAVETGFWIRAWIAAPVPPPRTAGPTTRVVVIGDSISMSGYPEHMERELKKKFAKVTEFDVVNLSRVSNVSAGVKKEIKGLIQTYAPDYVVLMLGKADFETRRKHESVLRPVGILAYSRLYEYIVLQSQFWKELKFPSRVREKKGTGEPRDRILGLFRSRIPDVNRLIRLGYRALQTNDLPAASVHLDRAYKKMTNAGEPAGEQLIFLSTLIAEAAASTDDMPKSTEFIERAESLLRNARDLKFSKEVESILWLQLSWAYKARDEIDLAARTAERAASIDPNLTGAYTILGLMHYRSEKYKEARAAFMKTLKDQPDDRLAISTLYQAGILDGSYVETRDTLRELLPRTQLKYPVNLFLARLEMYLQNEQAAKTYLDEANRHYDEGEKDLRSRMWIARELKQFEKVDQLFRESRDDDENPLTQRFVNNLREIVDELLAAGIYPIIAQYPNLSADSLRPLFNKYGAKVKVVATRDFLIAASRGDEVHTFFKFDFNHLTPRGAEIVGTGMADVIAKIQSTKE